MKLVDSTNYCPFGCRQSDLDEFGYCCHLVGFTGAGKRMERVTFPEKVKTSAGKKVMGADGKPQMLQLPPMVDGTKVEKVLGDDVLINPESIQHTDNGSHMMKKWVSSRVYRECTPEEAQEWRDRRLPKNLMDETQVGELAEAI